MLPPGRRRIRLGAGVFCDGIRCDDVGWGLGFYGFGKVPTAAAHVGHSVETGKDQQPAREGREGCLHSQLVEENRRLGAPGRGGERAGIHGHAPGTFCDYGKRRLGSSADLFNAEDDYGAERLSQNSNVSAVLQVMDKWKGLLHLQLGRLVSLDQLT